MKLNINKKTITIGGLALVLAMIVISISWFTTSHNRGEALTIAVIAPLTGEYAADGEDTLRGIQIALAEVNANGGVNGHPVKLRMCDDQNKKDLAVKCAEEITKENEALLVIGHAFSSSSIAAGEIYKTHGIPAISGSATTDAVTEDNPWYFRVIFNNQAQAAFIGNYVKHILNYDTVSIVYEQGTYGLAMSEAFRAAFTGVDGEIQFDRGFDPDSDTLDAELYQITSDIMALDNPGLIFMPAHVGPAVDMVTMMRRNGLDAPIMGTSALANIDFTRRLSKLPEESAVPGFFSEGLYATTPIIFDVANEAAQVFKDKFLDLHNTAPGMKAATNHDAFLSAIQALEATHAHGNAAQRAEEREAIRAYLAHITSSDKAIKGITGDIFFDDQGNFNQAVTMGRYTHGELIPNWIQLQPIPDLNHITDLQQAIEESRVLINSVSSMYKTNVVYTGLDINEVTDLDMKDSTYTIDFYLWFRYQGAFDDANIEFTNATAPIVLGPPIAETITGAYTYRVYRVKGKFRNEFDYANYPFDEQELSIRFRHTKLTRENLVYVRDSLGMKDATTAQILEKFSKAQAFNGINGWSPIRARFFPDSLHNNSTLGNPQFFDIDSDIEYSRFNADVVIKRDGLSFSLKNLFPLFIVVIVSYLVFYIPPRQLAVTNGLLRSALLAVAFFHQRLSGALPGVDYTVALDYPFYIFYILIVLTLVMTTVSHRADAAKKETVVKQLTQIGRWGYPIVILLSTLWFINRFDLGRLPKLSVAPAATEAISPGTTVDTTATLTANPLTGSTLHILQWEHFVPRYDEWFDAFATAWGAENGVNVSVDHIPVMELGTQLEQEIAIGAGHDLIEFISPPARYESDLRDLSDLNRQAQARFGEPVGLCIRSTYNPNTEKWYGFCHGWSPDPGNYRRSLWTAAHYENGPRTYTELQSAGMRIKQQQNVPIGLGMAQELDSNLAIRAVMWAYGGAVQDENENVVINSPETVMAVEYLASLYQHTMTDEVFTWNAASNNQGLFAGTLSYIINSLSAYRTAQKVNPEIANDIFFVPALKGTHQVSIAAAHVTQIYIAPAFSENAGAAEAFLLHFIANYDQAVYNSELYTFPAWRDIVPRLYSEGGWLDEDPFGSEPADKLTVLKDATQWTVNVGYPGPANAAIGEVFDSFILPDMVAQVAQGELSAQEAVAAAEQRILPIFEKWHAEGLVGGEH